MKITGREAGLFGVFILLAFVAITGCDKKKQKETDIVTTTSPLCVDQATANDLKIFAEEQNSQRGIEWFRYWDTEDGGGCAESHFTKEMPATRHLVWHKTN